MNMDTFNEQISTLQHQIDDMCRTLDTAREERDDLLRQRFDLKEQRRYFRRQLQEATSAGNEDRERQLRERLSAIAQELETLDDKIEDLEDHIDDIEDDVEALRDAMADIEEEVSSAEASEDAHGFSFEFDNLEGAMDSLNKGLQKVLGKVADTLESIDLDHIGQNVHSAASKAAKTVSVAAQDAAKEVEHAYKDIKENRSKPGGMGDYRISGSGVLDGGCYNQISSSGSCKVSSDLICQEIKSSGSFRACGNVDCSGNIRTSGAFKCDGSVTSSSFSTSGSSSIAGDLKTGMLTSPGILSVGGSISATEMRSTGSLKVAGDCEADGFTASGVVSVGGIVNADVVNIQLSKAESHIGSIGGSQVTISQTPTAGFLSSLLMKPAVGLLVCESIEGDTVELTGVQADTVRGTNVVIHGGCRIERVEYSDTCTIDTDATVGTCEKL